MIIVIGIRRYFKIKSYFVRESVFFIVTVDCAGCHFTCAGPAA